VKSTLERVEITLMSVIFTRIRAKLTRVCRIKHTLRAKSHSVCGNLTLRVEINLVRVEITLVRFEITLVRVVIADLFFLLSWGGG
jgi:hypothetical protein